VGFEIFSSGRLLDTSVTQIVEAVRGLLDSNGGERAEELFGLATGAFRDAENNDELFARLYRELGVPVRVLSGTEEARLLVRAVEKQVRRRPAMLFDLGGGRLETVFLGSGQNFVRETLALGVIRVHQLALFDSGRWNEEAARRYVCEALRAARRFTSRTVYGTGGTVKAIARVLGRTPITLADIERLHADALVSGAPRFLTPRRREIFVPGLLVVEHLMRHAGARTLHCHPIAPSEVLIEQLVRVYKALGGELRRAFLEHDIDILTDTLA
jgi:exopolyphosphatase/pppGpp-phosphohydrolase